MLSWNDGLTMAQRLDNKLWNLLGVKGKHGEFCSTYRELMRLKDAEKVRALELRDGDRIAGGEKGRQDIQGNCAADEINT